MSLCLSFKAPPSTAGAVEGAALKKWYVRNWRLQTNMEIPQELIDLMDKQSSEMEKEMISAFARECSIDALVEIAMAQLREDNTTED
jgi:hypothetical protein